VWLWSADEPMMRSSLNMIRVQSIPTITVFVAGALIDAQQVSHTATITFLAGAWETCSIM